MKKSKGFTLIEMLIVVAIIGILAALLIPNAMSAIQKAKQKGTMKDLNSIAGAVTDYITDNGIAPTGQTWGSFSANFISALSGFYLKVMPLRDQWNYPFQALTGPGTPTGYTNVTNSAGDDFVLASFGRNRTSDPFTYQPTSPDTAYFQITGMASFNQDLVIWNGSWVHAPKAAQSGT